MSSASLREEQTKKIHQGEIDFEEGGYRDVPWAILYIVQLGVMVYLAVVNFKNVDLADRGETDTGNIQSNALYGVVAGLFASMAFSLVWMNVLKKFSSGIIKFMMFANIAGFVVLGILSVAVNPVIAIVFFVLAGLAGLYFYFVRRRIQFTSVMLEISIECIKKYGASIYLAIGFMLLSVGWLAVWSVAAIGSTRGENDDSEPNSVVLFFLIVSLFWTSYVLANVVHVTVAGVAATWYFTVESKQVTMASFKRATTTSFGSICLGSLIVSVISAVRAMLNAAREEEDSFIRCIADCLLSCLESIAAFISKYAYTYVAIYGDGFIPAAKKTWELLTNRGWDVLVNDDLSGIALGFSALLGGVVGGVVSAFVAGFVLDLNQDSTLAATFGAAILGAFLVMVMMSVLDSCVATFMVLWAESPEALSNNHQALYLKLSDAIRHMYPDRRF